jgi:tRNA(Ile)-lysidine synthase
MSFLTTVQKYIDSHMAAIPQTKVIVAVSGGPDSMALLFGLHHWCSRYGFSLIVAHVNHMLRGDEAWRDQAFVQQQAQVLGLPFYPTKVDVRAFQRRSGLSPEHAARQLRYHFLGALQHMLGARYIALGHTADDQAETLLVRFVRGSSPDSLAGVPTIRPPLIRPLIDVSRSTILTYLQSQEIPWIEDSSNTHRAYLRNRVRLDLLPTLQQYNPQIIKRLRILGELLQTDQAVLTEQVTAWSAKTVRWEYGNRVMIRCDTLRCAPLTIQRRVLKQIVHTLLPVNRPVGFQHIHGLQRLLTDGRHGQRYTLPGRVLAERHHETVLLWNTHLLPSKSLVLTLRIPGEVTVVGLPIRLTATVFYNTGQKSSVDNEAYINLQSISLPLKIRFSRPGDRFRPLGMQREKKLQDFFIDNKVRQAERAYIPLVISQGEIVWVVGHRISESFKVHSQTKYILCLRCLKTEDGIV